MRNIASVFRRLQIQRALIALVLGTLVFVSTACSQPYSTKVSWSTTDPISKYPVFGLEKEKVAPPEKNDVYDSPQTKEPPVFNRKQNPSTLDEEFITPKDRTKRDLSKDESPVDYGDLVIRSVSAH